MVSRKELMKLVNTHPYGFRCGELADVIGLVIYNARFCWHVRYADGIEDYVVTADFANYRMVNN